MTREMKNLTLLSELRLFAGLYHCLDDGKRTDDIDILEVVDADGGVGGYFLNGAYYRLRWCEESGIGGTVFADTKYCADISKLGYLLGDQYYCYQDSFEKSVHVANYKRDELIFDEGLPSESRLRVRQL